MKADGPSLDSIRIGSNFTRSSPPHPCNFDRKRTSGFIVQLVNSTSRRRYPKVSSSFLENIAERNNFLDRSFTVENYSQTKEKRVQILSTGNFIIKNRVSYEACKAFIIHIIHNSIIISHLIALDQFNPVKFPSHFNIIVSMERNTRTRYTRGEFHARTPSLKNNIKSGDRKFGHVKRPQ